MYWAVQTAMRMLKEFSKHNVLSFSYKIKVRYKKSFQKINLLLVFQTLFSSAAQYSSKWRKLDRILAFYFIFCFPDRVKDQQKFAGESLKQVSTRQVTLIPGGKEGFLGAAYSSNIDTWKPDFFYPSLQVQKPQKSLSSSARTPAIFLLLESRDWNAGHIIINQEAEVGKKRRASREHKLGESSATMCR